MVIEALDYKQLHARSSELYVHPRYTRSQPPANYYKHTPSRTPAKYDQKQPVSYFVKVRALVLCKYIVNVLLCEALPSILTSTQHAISARVQTSLAPPTTSVGPSFVPRPHPFLKFESSHEVLIIESGTFNGWVGSIISRAPIFLCTINFSI